MTILRARTTQGGDTGSSASARENLFQFLRRHRFKLRVGAIFRPLVGAPSVEVRHMPEATALHVLVSHFDDKLRTQGLP